MKSPQKLACDIVNLVREGGYGNQDWYDAASIVNAALYLADKGVANFEQLYPRPMTVDQVLRSAERQLNKSK